MLGGEAGLLFFVSITRCQCVAIPFRHGQAVVVAGCHQWTPTGHPSPYHIMTPPPAMVLWVQGSLASGSGSFSPHHPSHSHVCPGQSTALGHRVLLLLPVLQPRLRLLCQDPQSRLRMLDWTPRLARGPAPVDQSASPREGSRADI